MLTIKLPATEDEPACELQLQHSLVSLSKWEAIYRKPFHSDHEKTGEETVTYIEQMVVSPNPPEHFVARFTKKEFEAVNAHINGEHTATTFHNDKNQKRSREVVTAELIYHWMIDFQIPFTCDTWHLSQLMTLIRIRGIKQTKQKPMSRREQAEQYRQLNAQRRQQLGTNG